MRGLVLEGGGAKGAYEAGAIKALQKKKIYFDGVSGTSIGAINAAFYAERNLTGLYKLWESTDSSELFGIDGEFLNNISHLKFKKSEISGGVYDKRIKKRRFSSFKRSCSVTADLSPLLPSCRQNRKISGGSVRADNRTACCYCGML